MFKLRKHLCLPQPSPVAAYKNYAFETFRKAFFFKHEPPFCVPISNHGA